MKNTKGKQNKCIQVLYDGECEMCVFLKDKAQGWGKEKIELIDIRKNEYPQNFSAKQLLKEIHVVDENGKVLKNIDAILKVLEVNTQYKFIAKVGNLPVIKPILALGYKLVANNRKFIFGKFWRIYWTKIVVAIAFLVGILLSNKLWLSTRYYPLTPFLPLFRSFSYPLDTFFLGALILLLIAIITFSRIRFFALIFLSTIMFLFLQDQSRLQPWAYQYAFMIGLLAVFSWNKEIVTEKQSDFILNSLRLLVAMIYIWSGVHKLNHVFINEIFPWMNAPFIGIKYFLAPFASLAPFMEIGVGVGLLIKPLRKYAILSAISLHVYILLSLILHNWNNVVWPWNLAMMFFVFILFWKSNVSFREIVFQKGFLPHLAILTFFVSLPLLSFFGHWDSYLSFALYSGDTKGANILISSNLYKQLPNTMKKYSHSVSPTQYDFDYFTLSMNEMNVPPYPETRIYKSIAKDLCSQATDLEDVQLRIYQQIRWFDFSWSDKQFDCKSL